MKQRADPRENDAALCRLRGWVPGDILLIDRDPLGTMARPWIERFKLTAIGERTILFRQITQDGRVWREEASLFMLRHYPITRESTDAK